MKRLKQVTCALLMAVVLVSGSSMVVNAQIAATAEFGTLSYSLTRSGRTVTAMTSVERTANKLLTGLDIQINATGRSIASGTITKDNARVNNIAKVVNRTNGTQLACFSSHEARGQGSEVRYLAEKF